MESPIALTKSNYPIVKLVQKLNDEIRDMGRKRMTATFESNRGSTIKTRRLNKNVNSGYEVQKYLVYNWKFLSNSPDLYFFDNYSIFKSSQPYAKLLLKKLKAMDTLTFLDFFADTKRAVF